MSASGNMMPQSRTMMRPSTSMQAQLRPISPSPPRKTTRTGDALGRDFAYQATGWPVAIGGPKAARIWRPGVEFGGRCAHGQTALSDTKAHGAADRLGGQAGSGTPRWTGSRWRRAARALPAIASARSPRRKALDHRSELRSDPVRRHADGAHGADRQQGQSHHIIAAVDLETRRKLEPPDAPCRPGLRPRP